MADVEAITAFIRTRNQVAATRIVTLIEDAAGDLAEFPLLGRQEIELGVRMLNVPKTAYSIYYNVEGQEVWILHIRDGRRRPLRLGEV